MKKLYTEAQYREYSNLLEKMANEDDILEGFNIHVEIEDWIVSNKLSEIVMNQMDDRMEKEFMRECNGEVNKDSKIIDFPKK